MGTDPDSPPPNLDLDASLARLRRWRERVEGAIADFCRTEEAEPRRVAEHRVKDFAIASCREVGDLVLKAREQLEIAWGDVGVSSGKARRRAAEWIEFCLKPHPTLRGFMAARHADVHLGGLEVPRLELISSGNPQKSGTVWMSPRIPEGVHDRLRSASQLTEAELQLFNSPDELGVTLYEMIEAVERLVAAAREEADRIREEEVLDRPAGAGPSAPTA